MQICTFVRNHQRISIVENIFKFLTIFQNSEKWVEAAIPLKQGLKPIFFIWRINELPVEAVIPLIAGWGTTLNYQITSARSSFI